jgi:hypothetical protein
VIIASIVLLTAGFIWFEVRGRGGKKSKKSATQVYTETAEQDVERIFNNEFREELRNRGRLHFEKIIGENAMFLQQDLRLTTSQLNEYMKQEITRTLQEEFAKYEESITDAKQLAIDSITKTQEVIEQQRSALSEQLQKQVDAEKENVLKRFDENMADIVNHYVLAAIGNQIDLSDQLEYILGDLDANKQAIIEDIRNGA